jgi:hypothetical protein
MQTIIRLANVAGFSVLFTGTQDIASVIRTMVGLKKSTNRKASREPSLAMALQQQYEVTRRTCNSGYFEIGRALTHKDEFFYRLTTALFKYQWLDQPLALNEENRELFHLLSAGIPSLMVLLHRVAQRIALSTSQNALTERHYFQAHDTHLAPMAPLLKQLTEGRTNSCDFEKAVDEFMTSHNHIFGET